MLLCKERVTRTASLRIRQLYMKDVGNIIKLGLDTGWVPPQTKIVSLLAENGHQIIKFLTHC